MGLTKEGRGFLGKFLGPIERHLRAIECYTSTLDAGAGPSSITTSDTQSNTTLANLATLSSGTHAASLGMRAVEILSNGGGGGELLQVVITKSDASVLTFNTYHGNTWSYEGNLSEAPITDVVITNSGATTLSVILNVVSKL